MLACTSSRHLRRYPEPGGLEPMGVCWLRDWARGPTGGGRLRLSRGFVPWQRSELRATQADRPHRPCHRNPPRCTVSRALSLEVHDHRATRMRDRSKGTERRKGMSPEAVLSDSNGTFCARAGSSFQGCSFSAECGPLGCCAISTKDHIGSCVFKPSIVPLAWKTCRTNATVGLLLVSAVWPRQVMAAVERGH